jgi:Phage integrase, N-terminal SAM-like domain
MPSLPPPSAKSTNALQATDEGRARLLTRSSFFGLADLPPEHEWFASIDNEHTRRAYKNDLSDFMTFTGIREPIELRIVTRGHILAWRKTLEERDLSGATIRRKMAAISSLYEYLCEKNACP